MDRESAPRSALTELLRRPKVPPEWGKLFNIWVHDNNISDLELVINPNLFPTVQQGDCIVITDHNTTKRFVVCVPNVGRGPFKQRSFQLSIHQHLADRFGLKSRQNIYARKLEPSEIPIAETIIISFRDQYIGRIPMRIVRDHLRHGGTYTNKTIDFPSACRRAKVISMITSDGKNIESGLCSASCQAIFRSEAAKILLLIQLSPDLWQVEPETGKTVFEVRIARFLENLAQKWKEQGTNHLVSIVISAYSASPDQQRHEDYYSIPQYWMAQPAPNALRSLIVEEAQAILVAARRGGKVLVKPNDLNVLQGLSFSLKLIEECSRDRDLSKTGMSITMISGEGARLTDIRPKDHPLLRAVQNKISSYGIFTQQVSTIPLKESEDGLAMPTWLHNYEYIDGALRLSKGCEASEAIKSPPVIRPNDDKSSALDVWSDLVMPRCLKLQSGSQFFDDSLETEWKMVSKYRINEAPASLFLESSGERLLELQGQMRDLRLALGFQEAKYQGARKASCYVFGRELHLLFSGDTAIDVERYQCECPNEPSKSMDHPWRALVKSKFAPDYRHVTLSPFGAEKELEYPWEVVDNMIAGNDMREERSSSYWQSRFLLIPADEAPRNSLIMATAANEILDDEELRLAGFIKFCEAFQRAALSRPSPTSSGSERLRHLYPSFHKLSSIEFLKIQFTTQSCTAYARQEFDKLETTKDDEGSSAKVQLSPTNLGERDGKEDEDDESKVEHVAPLNTTDPLGHIAVMMQHPLFGLSIKNRRWHWRIYRSVFVGSMAVDWMLKFFTDIESRERAVEFGNVLLDAGVWEHIFGTHGFLDGYYYYRFGVNFDLRTLRLSNPKILKTVSSKEDMNADQGGTAIHSTLPPIPTDRDEKSGPIVMSRSMLITTDMHRHSPGRREWAFLHYDSSHNPRNAFHFRLHWSTCSSRLVDELIQSWSRRAAQCGFMLVEAPVEDPCFDELSCIDSPMVMELACAPPKIEELQERLGQELGINKLFFMEELLRRHGFVLDHEGDSHFPEYDSPRNKLHWSYSRQRHERTQYIHQSGVALVQIDEDRLLWTPNRLFLATSSGRCLKKSQQFQSYELEEELRMKLAGLCANADALEEFWRSVLEFLGKKVGVDSILDNIPDNMTERGDDWAESPVSIFDRIAMLEDMVKHSL